MFIKITAIEGNTHEEIQEELKDVFAEMDKSMRIWTSQAARMECGWICADCCGSDHRGMPDECMHGQQFCTDIITRDKKNAWAEVKHGAVD
jgi:hypothetical protein